MEPTASHPPPPRKGLPSPEKGSPVRVKEGDRAAAGVASARLGRRGAGGEGRRVAAAHAAGEAKNGLRIDRGGATAPPGPSRRAAGASRGNKVNSQPRTLSNQNVPAKVGPGLEDQTHSQISRGGI